MAGTLADPDLAGTDTRLVALMERLPHLDQGAVLAAESEPETALAVAARMDTAVPAELPETTVATQLQTLVVAAADTETEAAPETVAAAGRLFMVPSRRRCSAQPRL